MIKIIGIKMNNLTLLIDGVKVGILDNDHNKIYLDYTEEEWTNAFNIDISFEVAKYYDEIDIIDDEVIQTCKYDVVFEEEEEEYGFLMKSLF